LTVSTLATRGFLFRDKGIDLSTVTLAGDRLLVASVAAGVQISGIARKEVEGDENEGPGKSRTIGLGD
jgi:hypothetical protein